MVGVWISPLAFLLTLCADTCACTGCPSGASVTKKTAAAQMSATAPYYSIPFSGRVDFLYSHDSLLTLLMRGLMCGATASCADLHRDSGVLPRHSALAKAHPLGMAAECHEAGTFVFMHPWMAVSGAPIEPRLATDDAQSWMCSASPTGFRAPSGQLHHFESLTWLPEDPYEAVLYPPRGPH